MKNNYTEKLYEDLMELVKTDESFYFKDFPLEDKVYRIFNYNLANWSSFQKAGALDCRGTMYDVTNANDVILVSLPPQKFFNYEEGNVDHTICKLGDKMVKMDGSLISTYKHNNQLYLKSKGSLFSDQANDSMVLLEKNEKFKEELIKLVDLGYTVNLEYTSPKNRIVVRYQQDDLTILSARNNADGKNIFATSLKRLLEENNFNELIKNLVSYEDLRNSEINQKDFIDEIRKEQQGEGYVQEFIMSSGDSYLGKVKNLKYISLHHTKDSVNSPRRLFEAIINEATDDLKSMFADDEYMLDKIESMERKVIPLYNKIIQSVKSFYENNKDLSRKDFALKVQKDYPKISGLIMSNYVNEKIKVGEIPSKVGKDGKPYIKEVEYKDFAIKYRKEVFGITDEEPELDDDGNVIKKHVGISNKE